MSIALDAALYLREQKISKPLTLTERGLLFTLLFRVGSNPFAWVSQETLSIESDTDLRSVKRLLGKISKKGFIEVSSNPKDKRKNLYRPAEFLINYHQLRNREQTKEYRAKLPPNLEDRGQNYPLNTGQNYPLSQVAQNHQTSVAVGLQEVAQIPKDTDESNTKSKATLFCASDDAQLSGFDTFWNVYPRKKDKKRTGILWKNMKLDNKLSEIMQSLKKQVTSDPQWQNAQYIPHPSTWLKGERWNDEIAQTQVAQPKMKLVDEDKICSSCKRPERKCQCHQTEEAKKGLKMFQDLAKKMKVSTRITARSSMQ